MLDLDVNENLFSLSSKTLVSLTSGKYFYSYLDPKANELREALSQYVGVPKMQLMAGTGVNESIEGFISSNENNGRFIKRGAGAITGILLYLYLLFAGRPKHGRSHY